jgi:predicted nucleic acid-binding protein
MMALDTDVLIDIRRRVPAAVAWLQQLAARPFIPGFAAMELLQGVRNKRELVEVQKFLARFNVVWPTEADCAKALADFTALQLSHALGLLDALIAATVVGRGATLCTFNVKHYRAVPALATAQPYPRS